MFAYAAAREESHAGRDRQALSSIKPEGTFAVELSCPSEALRVEVAGVGVLPCPISAAMAEQLCAMARPAPFGRRDSTLHDKRVRDTWSIAAPTTCTCPLCRKFSAFLLDRVRVELPWPLGEQDRAHVHRVIDRHRLPVSHVTIRQGRPYTLLLAKKKTLFALDRKLREEQAALLAELRREHPGSWSPDGPRRFRRVLRSPDRVGRLSGRLARPRRHHPPVSDSA